MYYIQVCIIMSVFWPILRFAWQDSLAPGLPGKVALPSPTLPYLTWNSSFWLAWQASPSFAYLTLPGKPARCTHLWSSVTDRDTAGIARPPNPPRATRINKTQCATITWIRRGGIEKPCSHYQDPVCKHCIKKAPWGIPNLLMYDMRQ